MHQKNIFPEFFAQHPVRTVQPHIALAENNFGFKFEFVRRKFRSSDHGSQYINAFQAMPRRQIQMIDGAAV